ncbi:MAG: DUF4386 domain-containing protein [Anaerolineae bacterium]
MNLKEKFNPTMYARIAGVMYMIIVAAAIPAHFIAPERFRIAGDVATTAANIAAGQVAFSLGTVGGELIIVLTEIALIVVMYKLLAPVNQTLSAIAAAFRGAMATIHGLNLLNYYVVFQLLNDENIANVFSSDQINALVNVFLNAHDIGFTLGIVFFIPHVLILGYLIYRSDYFPRMLGVLFLIAGFGYLIDGAGLLFAPGYTETPGLIAIVIASAEIAFPIWLLIKGVRIDEWQQRTLRLEPA